VLQRGALVEEVVNIAAITVVEAREYMLARKNGKKRRPKEGHA
jgi:hypothetical protein